MLRRGVTGGRRPGLLATSLNEIFGVLRGAVVPYLKGGVELIIEGISVFVMALYLAREVRRLTWRAWWRWCRPARRHWRARFSTTSE